MLRLKINNTNDKHLIRSIRAKIYYEQGIIYQIDNKQLCLKRDGYTDNKIEYSVYSYNCFIGTISINPKLKCKYSYYVNMYAKTHKHLEYINKYFQSYKIKKY